MNRIFWKRLGILLAGAVVLLYLMFLSCPLILNPLIEGYIPQIKNIIKETTGLNSNLEGVKVVTTPKLTAGLKAEKFELSTPENKKILIAGGFRVKMSLLPLFARRIEIDAVQLDNAEANLLVMSDGTFEVEKYFPKSEETEEKAGSEPAAITGLPLGFKLSNHLPDIEVKNYTLTITDGADEYTLSGFNTKISDFILNKSIRVKASGKAVLKGREQFSYDVKILNKIMPDMELDELVFNPAPAEEKPKEEFERIDIIGILKGIYANNLTAKANADLTIAKEGIKGQAEVTNLSIINLPPSFVKLKFKENSIDILSDIYTAKSEVSKIDGIIKTGKNPDIDLNFKSKVEIANILKIVKDIAVIFDIKDLQTLTANGSLDANFNIKSNLKTVKSNGYLKIPSADVYYGLYKIGVDNINADVKLNNNNININNIGFSILNQPLKLYGTITSDAVSDLHLTAQDLSLKGLLVAVGQAALMKENQVNSGLISMKADVTGRLDKINPAVKVDLNNINIKNIPSNTTLRLPTTTVGITTDGKTFSGTAKSSNILIVNPCAKISAPQINATIKENEIDIAQTPVTVEKINFNISGKIKNYLTEKIELNFATTGDIKSTLSGIADIAKQTLNLNFATTESSTIIIPMFDKSKMTFTGNIHITDSMMNPILNGTINIPSLEIPEIPVVMSGADIKLNGHILKGSAAVQKFASGGIEAQNLTGDFSLKGDNFYLNNLKGDAFDGKINGNIIYNITNAKTSVEMSGENMNAEKTVRGGVGIKNAISGTLNFNTKLSLTVTDYNEMMKSLAGNLKFNVKNGAFGSIGRLDQLLLAGNIISNSVLKTTTQTLVNNTGLADTAKFDYIDGNLNFKDGWAKIEPIKSSGAMLAYYISGKYNLINGTTNVNLLGRLDAQIVAKLGPLGQLSAEKLLSYIPNFGSSTAKIVNALTADPKGENTDAIPALTSGSTEYKDFKVQFNGGLESTSSVKSFKWLTDVDTSAIETKSVSETVKEITTSVNEDLTNTVNSVKEAVSASKEEWNATKEQWKNSAEELKNMFKFKSETETVPES